MKSVFEKLGLTEENAGVFDGEWRGGGSEDRQDLARSTERRLASIRTASDDDYEKTIARAHEAFEKWRNTPGPVRGDTVRRLGNALREAKARARSTRDARDRQDSRRRRRRSAGDDRHLRFCRRPIANALRPDHSIGTAKSSFDGAMASARSCRGDQRIQFSSRGLVVERGAGRRLR